MALLAHCAIGWDEDAAGNNNYFEKLVLPFHSEYLMCMFKNILCENQLSTQVLSGSMDPLVCPC